MTKIRNLGNRSAGPFRSRRRPALRTTCARATRLRSAKPANSFPHVPFRPRRDGKALLGACPLLWRGPKTLRRDQGIRNTWPIQQTVRAKPEQARGEEGAPGTNGPKGSESLQLLPKAVVEEELTVQKEELTVQLSFIFRFSNLHSPRWELLWEARQPAIPSGVKLIITRIFINNI